MRQRVMIAMALACNPKVLIADEPTTALDVTIQAQILDLMVGLNRDFGTAIILITHDLGVVAEVCKRVNVMYAGKIVESGPSSKLFANPQHPYTMGLLKSVPSLGDNVKERAASDRRASARFACAAAGLPIPAALPTRAAEVPRGTAADGDRARPESQVLVPRRRIHRCTRCRFIPERGGLTDERDQ